jgi:hypothetical protein
MYVYTHIHIIPHKQYFGIRMSHIVITPVKLWMLCLAGHVPRTCDRRKYVYGIFESDQLRMGYSCDSNINTEYGNVRQVKLLKDLS